MMLRACWVVPNAQMVRDGLKSAHFGALKNQFQWVQFCI